MKRSKREPDTNLALGMPFVEALERFARVNTKDIGVADIDAESELGIAAPFVKWAGGKRQLIDELTGRLPAELGNYYEPFAGGAALFFQIHERLTNALLSDTNFDLVITFNVIKREPEALIAALEEHARKHNEKYYYRVRGQHELQEPVKIAARLLYLNKTCYNGLYRVNKAGEFNVPIGSYINPNIIQRDNILACSKALQKARIEYREFDTITPQTGDFVYFDPPYHPTISSGFTGYTKLSFTEQDQVRLRDFALSLHKAGVRVMLSNSDTPFIRDLFKASLWHTFVVQVPRSINCKPDRREAVNELLITNYPPP